MLLESSKLFEINVVLYIHEQLFNYQIFHDFWESEREREHSSSLSWYIYLTLWHFFIKHVDLLWSVWFVFGLIFIGYNFNGMFRTSSLLVGSFMGSSDSSSVFLLIAVSSIGPVALIFLPLFNSVLKGSPFLSLLFLFP